MNLVTAREIRKTYRTGEVEVQALKGLSFDTEENHVIGDRILVTIELSTKDKVVLVGEIIWASKKVGAERTYGIKYIDLSPEQLKHLEELLPRDKSNKFPPF